MGQASNPAWYEHRIGRITGSTAHRVKHHKKGDSVIEEIMGRSTFRGNSHTEYGRQCEPVAKSHYRALMRIQHKSFQLTDSGLIVSKELPFLGASPDGLVSCSCHGPGLLEIKSPSIHRDLTVDDICSLGTYHVEHDENMKMQLKTSSQWYSQIQFQLAVTGLEYCDFVLYTQKAPYITTERILFDRQLWAEDKKVYTRFFKQYVAPSLLKQEGQ